MYQLLTSLAYSNKFQQSDYLYGVTHVNVGEYNAQ
jgi:hypothetical protein